MITWGISDLKAGTGIPADGTQLSDGDTGGAEERAQQGPYLYQPSESRSARVIGRAGSPARSESSAFSRQAQLLTGPTHYGRRSSLGWGFRVVSSCWLPLPC